MLSYEDENFHKMGYIYMGSDCLIGLQFDDAQQVLFKAQYPLLSF